MPPILRAERTATRRAEPLRRSTQRTRPHGAPSRPGGRLAATWRTPPATLRRQPSATHLARPRCLRRRQPTPIRTEPRRRATPTKLELPRPPATPTRRRPRPARFCWGERRPDGGVRGRREAVVIVGPRRHAAPQRPDGFCTPAGWRPAPPRRKLHGPHDGNSSPTHNAGSGNADSGGTWSAVVARASPHHRHIGLEANSRRLADWYAPP